MPLVFKTIDRRLIRTFSEWGIPALRIALAIVYLWFGILKIAGASPVVGLIESLYPALPEPAFLVVLGIWEVLIGLGLLTRKCLRTTLALLWLQMGGIMLGLIIAPGLFFQGANPLLLNLNGEFLIKNLVFIAASLVVGGHDVRKMKA